MLSRVVSRIPEFCMSHWLLRVPLAIVFIQQGLSKIPVTMIHGSKDEVVPVSYSRKVISLFRNAKKSVIIINKGDHSLSSKRNLKKINYELNKIVLNVI